MSVLPEPGVISFARGIPAPEMLPAGQLVECSGRALAKHGRTALNYGPPEGFGPLREWIAARHAVAPERVIVTPGSLVAMNMLVSQLVAERQQVVVEAPTYDRMLHLLDVAGADLLTLGGRPTAWTSTGSGRSSPAAVILRSSTSCRPFTTRAGGRSPAASASSSPRSRSSTGSW